MFKKTFDGIPLQMQVDCTLTAEGLFWTNLALIAARPCRVSGLAESARASSLPGTSYEILP